MTDDPAAAPETTASLPGMSEPRRMVALARYRVLRPHLDDGVPLTDAARSGGVPRRTAQRWVTRYRDFGLAGLAPPERADKGRRRIPADVVRLIEGLMLRRPPPTVALAHRQAVEVAERRDWPKPSYATVYDIARHLDPALLALAHDGTKRYREVYDLVYRRNAEHPNDIWQADHTQLDLWVLDPTGKPARPWLTSILDDHSRAGCGYAVNLGAPSALQTSLALRQAIWRKDDPAWHVCGIPAVFYVDHGSDFTSRHLEQVAAASRYGWCSPPSVSPAAGARSSATSTA